MKKFFFIICCSLVSASLAAQKTVHKVVEGDAVSTVEIDAAQVYELTVKTAKSSKIDIKAVMEGEYRDDLVIKTRETAGRLIISSSFRPSFQHPNDKLSAHKVISVRMTVELPENSNLVISGNNVNISVGGSYNSVKANTKNGNFVLDGFSGNGEIRNFEGDIFVNRYTGRINPHSRYGKVLGHNIAKEKTNLTLKTVNGDIYIDKPRQY